MRASSFSLKLVSRPLLLGILVATVALAGCVGEEDPETVDPAAATACAEGDGVLEIHIVENAWDQASTEWYTPADPVLDGIHTVCWVNDDTQWHRIIGTTSATGVDTTPEWVLAAKAADSGHGGHGGHGGGHDHGGGGGHDHGGGGHDHGGAGAPPPLFDFEIDPEARVAMPVTGDMAGVVDVHCHPHPWMVSTWQVLPTGATEYPVEVNRVVYYGSLTDVPLSVGGTKDVALDLSSPNLARVSATVTWSDDEAIGPTGSLLNSPDTIEVSLLDATGTVVASERKTSGDGQITVEALFDNAWPETAAGKGQEAAAANLTLAHPDDMTQSGTWTVSVRLVSAPGPAPDTDGTTGPAQSASDGVEKFTLTVEADHEYGKVLPTGQTPAVVPEPTAQVQLTLA